MLYYPSDLMLTETDSAAWRVHNWMKKKKRGIFPKKTVSARAFVGVSVQ